MGSAHPEGRRVSRRGFLGMAGVGAAAVTATGVGIAVTRSEAQPGPGPADAYPFLGTHQAGIVTPAQDRLHFAAFDVTTTSRDELVALLREWTAAAQQLTAGKAIGGPRSYDAPPDDTGEAEGLPASGLTLTFGFGPGLFDRRFGLAGQRPAALADLPHFPGDTLDPDRSGGDLCVQACANDPQVAVHAVRNLARIGFGRAAIRWSQLGFGRTSSTSTAQATPRNLFGFKDGTANIMAEDSDALRDHVWVQPGDDPDWMTDGSYLVARRIRMTIETWDRTTLREQEAVIGRTRPSGAPLSGGEEFTEPDFALAGSAGPLIPQDSHLASAHPSTNDGARMLRRGYNFTDGNDSLGRLDAGLFFLAFQRDIRTAFLPVQTRLARNDALNEYIRHVGSATFAIPPGVTDPNGFVGETLLT